MIKERSHTKNRSLNLCMECFKDRFIEVEMRKFDKIVFPGGKSITIFRCPKCKREKTDV